MHVGESNCRLCMAIDFLGSKHAKHRFADRIIDTAVALEVLGLPSFFYVALKTLPVSWKGLIFKVLLLNFHLLTGD